MDETVSAEQYKKNALKLIELFRIEQNGIPSPLANPNYSVLLDVMKKYIHLLQIGKIGDDDFKQEIFIAAVEATFGNTIWEWVQKHTKTRR